MLFFSGREKGRGGGIGGVGVGMKEKETISELALASLYYSVVLQDCYLSEDYIVS